MASEFSFPAVQVSEEKVVPVTPAPVKRVLEAALMCLQRPVTTQELCSLFEPPLESEEVLQSLTGLAEDYSERGIELVALEEGWRIRCRADMAQRLGALHPGSRLRYSTAVLEVLAVIAYRQPVTRSDIEEVRGISVGLPLLLTLQERGWIEVIGTRAGPGSPALWATTNQFLDYLGLFSLDSLQPLSLETHQEPDPS